MRFYEFLVIWLPVSLLIGLFSDLTGNTGLALPIVLGGLNGLALIKLNTLLTRRRKKAAMHTTTVVLNNGEVHSGPLGTVNIKEQWFNFWGGDRMFKFDECASVVTENERISINEVGDDDCLPRWLKERQMWLDGHLKL